MYISYNNDRAKVMVTIDTANLDALWIIFNQEHSSLMARFRDISNCSNLQVVLASGSEAVLVDALNSLNRQLGIGNQNQS